MPKTSRVVHRNSKSHVGGICQKGDSKNDEVAGMYITYMSDTCGDVPGKLFPFKNNYCVICCCFFQTHQVMSHAQNRIYLKQIKNTCAKQLLI